MPGLADTLPDRIRLPFSLDPDPLAADLERFEAADWVRHYVRGNYEGDWSAVPLRAAAGESHPIRMIGVHRAAEYVDTLYLDRAPSLRAALEHFPCPLKAVRLMRLAAGSIIKEHEDFDPEGETRPAVRLHVPITTSPEVEFLLNGTPVPMTPGSVWYLRLSGPHKVANRGASDRVHLVIDAWINDWLAEALRAGAAEAA